MLFAFGDVVAHVIHEAQGIRSHPKDLLKYLTRPVGNHLPIGLGIVRSAGHGRQILLGHW
jgi:hypothetical protein